MSRVLSHVLCHGSFPFLVKYQLHSATSLSSLYRSSSDLSGFAFVDGCHSLWTKRIKRGRRTSSGESANVSNLSNSQYNRVSYVITEVARGPSLCFGIALKRCILNSFSLALASLNNTLCISVQLRVSSWTFCKVFRCRLLVLHFIVFGRPRCKSGVYLGVRTWQDFLCLLAFVLLYGIV